MKGFSVDFVSPVGFDYPAAEICLDGQILCRVNVESADGALCADFFHETREPGRPLSFPLAEFIRLMDEVGDEISALRKNALSN